MLPLHRGRKAAARAAVASIGVQEFLHAFRDSLPPGHPDVKLLYPIFQVSWLELRNEFQSDQELRVMIEAHCSSIRQNRNETPGARISAQKCFLAEAHGGELFFGNDRSLVDGGDEIWRIRLTPKTS
jgi:hypothetical protein